MTGTDPTADGLSHAPDEAARWFRQWHLYRSIVDADWMCHREIFAAVRAWVSDHHAGPFSLADLGCGDAGAITTTFAGTGLRDYTGVDASETALVKAGEELAGACFHVRLVGADLLDFLRGRAGTDRERFDVILASYAVHHLPVREKGEFFRLARRTLGPGGTLLFADLFRREGESRDAYLEQYTGMMRREWTGVPTEDLASTIEHVTTRDFPETDDTVRALAREAGFGPPPRELFRDAAGFHRLLTFVTDERAG